MTSVFDASKFKFQSGQRFILDTNVWIFNVGSPSTNGNVALYSRLLSNIINSGGIILYNDLIISEFINRTLRIAYKGYCLSHGNVDYKVYRKTSDFLHAMASVKVSLDSIASIALPITSSNYSSSLRGVAIYMNNIPSDYNDIIISQQARAEGCFLVTDDGDMADFYCDIITHNKRIL